MSWFKKKPFVEDEVNALIDSADDERYKQMERISADLKQRLALLRRDADFVIQENNKA